MLEGATYIITGW